MTIQIDIDNACNADIPSQQLFQQWADLVAGACEVEPTLVTIRIVDSAESQQLNKQFRNKDKPTNVLSFPFEPDPGFDEPYLGDLAICAAIMQQEAEAQDIDPTAHWAHLSIHGLLHLLGYDHIEEKDAAVMESLESKLLLQLGFADPYSEDK